jgi:hypothetical protein
MPANPLIAGRLDQLRTGARSCKFPLHSVIFSTDSAVKLLYFTAPITQ